MSLSLAKLIAHRGAPRLAPENTLASLHAAKQKGAQWTEFDVTLTSDNIPVIFHDDTLERTTNGRGPIAQKSLSALSELDAGSWFSEKFKHCKIPTLEAYVQCAAKLHLAINVELKTVPAKKSEILVKTTLDTLKKHWPSQMPPPLLSSFFVTNLEWLKKLDCPYPIALNCEKNNKELSSIAKKLNCYSIHCNAKNTDQQDIQKNTAHGLKTLIYTINEKITALNFLAMGASAIFSDIPDLLD